MKQLWLIGLYLLALGSFAQEPLQPFAEQQEAKADTTTTPATLQAVNTPADTTLITSEAPGHDPVKAALLSAVLPGLGQAYNKKYWKIPFVWGGLAAFAYFIRYNDQNYQYYRRMLLYEIAQDPDHPNETGYDQATLKRARDNYRRWRDQTALYGILFYLVQIADAHVDAHLIEFDINEDLSVKLEPTLIPVDIGGTTTGFSIRFKF